MVSRGLATYQTDNKQIEKAMRSIKAVKSDSLTFFKISDWSFFWYYLCWSYVFRDHKGIRKSKCYQTSANGSRLTREWLDEAKRVGRERIIIKAHFRDSVFEELGFERQVRPNQKLHYGVMELIDTEY